MDDIRAIIFYLGLKLHIKKDYPVGTYFWHIHHNDLMETLTEPYITRVRYVVLEKSSKELKIRLAVMSPVKDVGYLEHILSKSFKHSTPSNNYYNDINRLHNREHINCPWDGHSLFNNGYSLPKGFEIR